MTAGKGVEGRPLTPPTLDVRHRAHARLVVCRELTDEAQSDCEVICELLTELTAADAAREALRVENEKLRTRAVMAEQPVADAQYHQETLDYLKRYDAAKVRHLREENTRLRVVIGELVHQMSQANITSRVSRIALDFGVPRKFETVHDVRNYDLIFISPEPKGRD